MEEEKLDKVFTASNGVVIELFGEMNVEALTRVLYGFKQKVEKDKK